MSDETQPLLVEHHGPVAVLTLNRPQAMNAYSSAMGTMLEDAYRECDANDDIRAVVVTGAGRAFCAGADFGGGKDPFGKPSDNSAFRSDPFTFHAWDVRKPVIAAVNGHAVGIGLTITLHCDLRIMATEGKYGTVQVRRGILGDLRSHWTLPRLVGHTRAAELLMTGAMFSASQAVAWGIANSEAPSAQVLEQAIEMGHDIARNVAPRSAAISKQILWSDPTSEQANELERLGHLDLMALPDAREGGLAFMEKRDPNWTASPSTDWPDWL